MDVSQVAGTTALTGTDTHKKAVPATYPRLQMTSRLTLEDTVLRRQIQRSHLPS
jgi:hypothetical protein